LGGVTELLQVLSSQRVRRP